MPIDDDCPRRRRRPVALLLALAAALVGSLLTAAPAAAHGMLVAAESTPVEGARIGEPMPDLSLVFTEAPAPFAYFSVTAPDGTRVDDGWDHGQPFPLGTPVQEFNLVDDVWEPVYYSTGFPVDLGVAHWPAQGDYTVEYRSVASDGDVVQGSYAFSYDGEVTAAPAGWTPPTDGPDPQLAAAEGGADAAPGAVDDPAAAPTQTAAQPAAAGEDPAADGPGVQPAVYVLVGLLVLAAVATIVVVGRRGRGAEGGRAARSGDPALRAGAVPAGSGRAAAAPRGRAARSGNPAVRAGGATGGRGGTTRRAPRR
ncbi:copper resistance CopC family protein [Aquipuribacter sp. MA13-6]|uniref:copper resistance CopC family protein n=1 Tax=unclassified Aquipuribacter TaxID=2635084 RepID=UPI003EEF0341